MPLQSSAETKLIIQSHRKAEANISPAYAVGMLQTALHIPLDGLFFCLLASHGDSTAEGPLYFGHQM